MASLIKLVERSGGDEVFADVVIRARFDRPHEAMASLTKLVERSAGNEVGPS
jgi:hypothetical protein